MMAKLFLTILKNPCRSLKDARDLLVADECAMVTDCKGLGDATQGETSQQATDKRVAIEGLLIRDLLRDLNCQWRWVSSERQLADGITKTGARIAFVERFQGGHVQLVADETYQAAKRKTKEDRERTVQETRGSTSRVARALIALVTAEAMQQAEGADAGAAGTLGRVLNFAVLFPYVMVLLMTLATVLWFASARIRASICAWWRRSTEGLREVNERLQNEVDRLQAKVEERRKRYHLIMCKQASDLDDCRDIAKDLRMQNGSLRKQFSDGDTELQIALHEPSTCKTCKSA